MPANGHEEESPDAEETETHEEGRTSQAKYNTSAEPQPNIGIAPFPRPDPNVQLASPSLSNVTAHPAASASSVGTRPSPESQTRTVPLGREDNTIAEYYRNRGPPGPPPIDTRENCRKGALVHACLALLRLDSANMHDEFSAFRQLCVALWSEDEVEGMKAYLIGTRDQSPQPTERAIFRAAFAGASRESTYQFWEAGMLHAAFTVVRLQGGDRDQAASDVRQLSSILWNDQDFQIMLNYVRNNHGAPTRKEERRFDQAELGMQAPERESDGE